MIFESHAHYDDRQFNEDREELLRSLPEHGISRVINIGCSIDSCRRTLEMIDKYEFMYGALGVHPSDIRCLNEENFAWIESQLSHEKVVAVGEIGLDYYWEKDPEVRKLQQYWFQRQMQLAYDHNLPVVIHSREAANDTWKMIEQLSHLKVPGVMHCYSYTKESAEIFMKYDLYFGIGGVVTYNNAKKLKEAVCRIPLDRILLETDCPYLSPVPFRGKRNSSLNLPRVVTEIAQLKGVSEEEVMKTTYENALRLFTKVKN